MKCTRFCFKYHLIYLKFHLDATVKIQCSSSECKSSASLASMAIRLHFVMTTVYVGCFIMRKCRVTLNDSYHGLFGRLAIHLKMLGFYCCFFSSSSYVTKSTPKKMGNTFYFIRLFFYCCLIVDVVTSKLPYVYNTQHSIFIQLIVIYPIRTLNDVINFTREYHTFLYLLYKNQIYDDDNSSTTTNNNSVVLCTLRALSLYKIQTHTQHSSAPELK